MIKRAIGRLWSQLQLGDWRLGQEFGEELELWRRMLQFGKELARRNGVSEYKHVA